MGFPTKGTPGLTNPPVAVQKAVQRGGYRAENTTHACAKRQCERTEARNHEAIMVTTTSENASSSDDKNNGKNYSNNNGSTTSKRNPYNVLNQSRNASTVEIQRAYKRGSRALHPDKQQAKVQKGHQEHTDEKDAMVLSDADVREAFVVLKEACEFCRRMANSLVPSFLVSHSFVSWYSFPLPLSLSDKSHPSDDILSDPCLRQAYDTFGYYGVEFVRQSLLARRTENYNHHSTEDDEPVRSGPSLYQTLSSLHAQGKDHEALLTLKEAIEFFQYSQYMQKYPTHAAVELHCRVLDAEDKSSFYSIEPQKVAIGFESLILSSTSLSPNKQQQQQSTGTQENNRGHDNNRWSVVLASNMSLKNGECSSQVATRLECYEVQPKTDIALEVTTSSSNDKNNNSMYNPPTLALTSTRILSTGTTVKVGAQAETNGKHPLALSLSTHRLLFDNSIGAAMSLGMGLPNQKLHYLSCSLTTLGSWPLLRDSRLNIALSLGMGRYPLKVSLTRANSNANISKTSSFGLDPMTGSWELKMSSIREVSKYVNLGIGIRDVSQSGLSVILFLQRGDHMTFKVPISIAKMGSSYYTTSLLPMPFKVARVGIASFLLDTVTHSILQSTVTTATSTLFTRYCKILQSLLNKKKVSSTESTWLPIPTSQGKRTLLLWQPKCRKGRRESEIQLQLMANTAEKKKWVEKSKNGLILVVASYFIPGTGQSLDVTSQLQFWVKDSQLTIPEGFSKARILGFYDLIVPEEDGDSNNLPIHLFVRYQFAAVLYEITVSDMDSLMIPNEHASRVENSTKVVQF